MDTTLLRSELETDINNRQTHLTTLKTMPTRYGFIGPDIDTHLRCAFPIIYAEWEGFFVYAMATYIREINKIGITLEQLDDKYYVNNIEKSFKQFKEYPGKFNQQKNFLRNLQAYFRNTGSISINSEINTESNLGFNVTNAIFNLFNIELLEDHIDHNSYSLKNDMDKFLLVKRNGLVHGDPTATATNDDITNGIALVERLFEEVKERIIKAADTEVYKK